MKTRVVITGQRETKASQRALERNYTLLMDAWMSKSTNKAAQASQ